MHKIVRYLRIAFSVVCGIICLLLIALWVRSYYYLDELSEPFSPTRAVCFVSIKGQLRCSLEVLNTAIPIQSSDWGLETFDSESSYAENEVGEEKWDFVYDRIDYWTLVAPHWFFVLASLSFAAVPWIPPRFSLRMLLVVITVIAVVLGAGAVLTR